MSSNHFNDHLFDEIDFEHDFFSEDSDLTDCYLSENELAQLLAPSSETWKDFLPNNNEAIVTIDSSREIQWRLAKEEIEHVRRKMKELISVEDEDDVSFQQIVLFVIGTDSKAGCFLLEELELDTTSYLEFISTYCTQAAYRASFTQLYHESSLLKEHIKMSEDDYIKVWRKMAEKKRMTTVQMTRTSRREAPLWETLERIVNENPRVISISGRENRIPVALDDDKIWMDISNAGSTDLFNLKYTTHVKPNRKGIVAPTAVSTCLNIPLGIVFEKTKDSTLECFKRCLNFLFSQHGETDLRNVSIHSDRGYMIPNLVFEFLLSSGAEVVGTVKRMAQCWLFTYDQVLKETDGRTLIDGKGAPTLYLKFCKAGHKYLFASAFRNGSGKVATAISTMHTQHHWEGVALKPSELVKYKNDETSLVSNFFSRVSALDNDERAEGEDEKEVLNELLSTKIDPYTLRQGKYLVFHLFYYLFSNDTN